MQMKTEKIVSNHTINSAKYRESRSGQLFCGLSSLYLYCDPLIPGKKVEFAALKHRKLAKERFLENAG